MSVPGFTSTGSKAPAALFGRAAGVPGRMVRAEGCRVWDAEGREYLDTVMALGAVALGYGHPTVTAAATRAARDGAVGPLAPVLEAEIAERLAAVIPGVEAVRFFKTGAEAVAAAVRIARVETGRERVLSCGYHGWLDWCQATAGVPEPVRALHRAVRFNDATDLQDALDRCAPVAALVLEPVVDGWPDPDWLETARRLTAAAGTVLVFDEIKTAFRIARGGVTERYGVQPDLVVVGKALGNGFPLAATGGPAALMHAAERTWISSTLATEFVSLAAAGAVLDVLEREPVVEHLAAMGARLHAGLVRLAAAHPKLVTGVRGVPQMCYLEFGSAEASGSLARRAAARGLLFKRTAYNFVSLAHGSDEVDTVLERLERALAETASHAD